jgi:hypothetical protein
MAAWNRLRDGYMRQTRLELLIESTVVSTVLLILAVARGVDTSTTAQNIQRDDELRQLAWDLGALKRSCVVVLKETTDNKFWIHIPPFVERIEPLVKQIFALSLSCLSSVSVQWIPEVLSTNT